MKHSTLSTGGLSALVVMIFTLTDARIALLFLVQSRSIAYVAWLALFVLAGTISAWLITSRQYSPVFFIIMAFGLWSATLGAVKGLSVGSVMQSLTPYLILPAAVALLRATSVTSQQVAKALLVFSGMHLVVYAMRDVWFSLARDAFTEYGVSSNMVGRFAGLWVAPGVLALFAGVVIAFGMGRYRILGKPIDLALMLAGMILGLASGNRSFLLIGVLLAPLLLLWHPRLGAGMRPISRTRYLIVVVGFPALLLLGGIIDPARLLQRFAAEQLAADIETRREGEAGFIPSIRSLAANPVTGNAVYHAGYDDLRVQFRGQTYSTSNGVASILVYNGIPAGLAFLAVYVFAILRYRRAARARLDTDDDVLRATLYFCILAASVVSLFDALLQAPLVLLLVVFAFERRGEQLSSRGADLALRASMPAFRGLPV